MKSPKKKDIILEYIKTNYDSKTPIFVNDIYKAFSEVSEGTIISLIKRFSDTGVLEKVDNGAYALPNKESVLGKATVYVSDVIESKYIRNEKGERIGYISGINFSNQIGLTSQTASVNTIYSNNVSNKKRMTILKNSRLIVNAPRVEITDDNYKLLQILDLLNEFEKYSEYDLKTASKKLLEFLGKIKLGTEEVESIVAKYPLEAQVKFYKIGGANAITSKKRRIWANCTSDSW